MGETQLARRVEEAGLNSWPARHALLYDGWIIRLSEGYTKRANSVTTLQHGGLPLAEKVAHCAALYERAGLPAIFRLLSFVDPHPLDGLLANAGYNRLDLTHVQVVPIAHRPRKMPASIRLETDREQWLNHYRRLRRQNETERQRHAAILQRLQLPAFPLLAYDADQVVGTALAVHEGRLWGLFDFFVDPAHRRQGHATRLLVAALALGHNHGAHHAYLQVMDDNHAARQLYAGFGFTDLYHYWYRRQAAPITTDP